MYRILCKAAPFIVLAALFSAPMTARAGSGFLLDGQGRPVRDSNGHCIQVGKLTTADAAFDCPGVRAPEHSVSDADTADRTAAPATSASTPGSAAPAHAPQTRPELTKHTLTLVSKQQFSRNSSYLSKAQKDELLGFVHQLLGHARLMGIHITSHADASGTEHYNRWLSRRRTASVAAYLRSLGVDPRIITTQADTGPGTLPRGIEISAIVMDAR